MQPSTLQSTILATAALVAASCTTTPTVSAPEVPAGLRPPARQTVFLETLATGVQIYECAPKSDQSAFEWAFRAPEAKLMDRAGKTIGQHYGGPTWESNDGSKVVGEVKARDPGPNLSAIPWLLLSAKSTSGNGVFTPTTSIQRVQTTGGLAPSLPCDAGSVKQMARVPYTATYYFYRAAQ